MSPNFLRKLQEGRFRMEIIFAGTMIIFMVIFLVMMWTIYSGMKKFLSDNIEEALIVSGDSSATA